MKPQNYNLRFVFAISLVSAMGGFLFGYDWVVVGGAKVFYEPYFQITDMTPFMRGWAQSSALFGCMIGAIIAGALTDRFGRKKLLLISGILFTVSAIGTGLAWDFFFYNVFRIIGGFGIGLASILSPMYIAEISPAEIRGRFVTMNQMTIVFGILAAQLINMQIAKIDGEVPAPDQIRLQILTVEDRESLLGQNPDLLAQYESGNGLVKEAGLDALLEAFDYSYLKYYKPATLEEKERKSREDNLIMSAYLKPTWNGRWGWRWMFGAETAPALLFFLLMLFVPESPRWLVKYGRNVEAARILCKVGGDSYASQEVADIQTTLAGEEIARVNFRDLLDPKIKRIIALGVFLAIFQQWCGINVIFNYAQEVFSSAGYGVSDIMFNIVVTGVVNVLFTFVAIFTVDKIGRKPLLLIGGIGLAIIYLLLGGGYYFKSQGFHMLLLVVSAIACYSMTLAPIVWVVISEIFPNRIRGAAMSIAVLALWIGCAALTLLFPYIKGSVGAHGAFWLYGLICFIGFIVVWRALPETKGKSLEQIERELAGY